MIVVAGQNPMGNVMHLIMGPESDLIQDVHGAIIMDITEVIGGFTKDSKCYVSISKCRNELATSNMMKTVGMKFSGGIAPDNTEKPCECSSKSCEAKPETGVTLALRDGKCSYCNANTKLMPIAGENICMPCIQIELGRKRKPAKSRDVHDEKV